MLLSKSFQKWHIVVLDDLERISDEINIEEVLGIVEELKKCNYVKVIMVTNSTEMEESNKRIFDKYNEKVVEKTYFITERPEKINWGEMGIHAGFIEEFLAVHKVKNLRTLQKAQRFYDDVRLICDDITDECFLEEIRLICFAIVVEVTDNLYYREPKVTENNGKPNTAIVQLSNNIEYRIATYLTNIKSGKSLVMMLLRYYKNEYIITKEDIEESFELFLKAGEKPNFYKNDEELKAILPSIYDAMKKTQKINQLNQLAEECIVWNKILQEDVAGILNDYKKQAYDLLLSVAMGGHDDVLNYDTELLSITSEDVKKAYVEVRNAVRRDVVMRHMEYLVKTTKGKIASSYAYKIKMWCENNNYRGVVEELLSDLYNEKSFPIGDIDVVQYDTCRNIMYVLYTLEEKRFLEYCDELKEKCDKMSAYRMNYIVESFVRGY